MTTQPQTPDFAQRQTVIDTQESQVVLSDEGFRASAPSYSLEWISATDRFELSDVRGRLIVAGPLQPAVTLASAPTTPGTIAGVELVEDELPGTTLRVTYEGVNGDDQLRQTIRFNEKGIWFSPVTYEGSRVDQIVSVTSFASWTEAGVRPGLESDYLVHPGASESSALGPVIPSKIRLDMTTWLGRGSNDRQDIVSQQWGLPIHYFGGFSIQGSMLERSALTTYLSDSFCMGLTAVPGGDLVLRHGGEKVSPELRAHSDLWGHLSTGNGPIECGASWVCTVAPTYDEAIRLYVRALKAEGIVTPKKRSDRQNEVLSTAQFNTWGAQCAAGTAVEHFSQEALETIYGEMRASGMQPGTFVVDDKWEGEYGVLTHDEERFPHFEQFLDRVREDGLNVGLWAAFLRCDNPATHGLDTSHMLCGPDGTPVTRGNLGHEYYLFDVSQEIVRERLTYTAQQFMRRYRPDLVKFDFGYELPAQSFSAPKIREWGGEILLVKALELVIGAMREVNPDVVVMYYNLSPLLTEYVDLHSTDDMFLCADEYHSEANRRMFFSSILGEVGVPSYGSGGYDWLRIRDIWFDSAPFGAVGSLGSFVGDPRDSSPTPGDLAVYNGLSNLTRPGHEFTVEPLNPFYLGGSAAARSSSWARYEEGTCSLVALRAISLDGARLSPELPGVLSSTQTVVVSSLDGPDLALAGRIGLVSTEKDAPDSAIVTLRGRAAAQAQAVLHLWGGATAPGEIVTRGNDVACTVPSMTGENIPVEWVEVLFENPQNNQER